jgi:hypothetical protein
MTEILKTVAMIKIHIDACALCILLTSCCFLLCGNLCRIKLEVLFAERQYSPLQACESKASCLPGSLGVAFILILVLINACSSWSA